MFYLVLYINVYTAGRPGGLVGNLDYSQINTVIMRVNAPTICYFNRKRA